MASWARTPRCGGTAFAALSGGSLVALSGTPSLTTVTTGTSGTLNYSLTGGTVVTGSLTLNSLTLANAGTSDLLSLGINALTFASGGGLLDAGTTTYSITGTGLVGAGSANEFIVNTLTGTNLSISNPLIGAGAGGLTKAGGGTLTLTGSSAYTGATNMVSKGLLATGTANVLPDTSAVVVFKGATLSLGGYETVGSLAGAGGVVLGGNRFTVGVDDTVPAAFSGALSGTGNLVKLGTGDLVLTGTSSFVGDVTVNAGVLVAASSSALGAANNLVAVNGYNGAGFNGGMLVLDGGSSGITVPQRLLIVGSGPTAYTAPARALSSAPITSQAPWCWAEAPLRQTSRQSTAGNTTLSGAVNLGVGAGAVANFTGNGNIIISGTLSGFESSTNRLTKGTTNLLSGLWLQNPNNNFLSSVRIDSGFVRVSDGGALGRNATTSAIQFNSGVLEVRADAATIPSFATKNFSTANSTLFVDRAVGGTGLGLAVTFGPTPNLVTIVSQDILQDETVMG
jgi:autotransporter-associated beta strand protein